MLEDDLIDDIGKYLGFIMWNTRDETKEYDFPNARDDNCLAGDSFIEGHTIVYNRMPLLIYKNKGCFHGVKSLYTFNLLTLKPTKNSKIQKLLSPKLVEKIKLSMQSVCC